MESPLKRPRLLSPLSPGTSIQFTPRLGILSSALNLTAFNSKEEGEAWDRTTVIDLSAERGKSFELLVVVSLSLSEAQGCETHE